MDTDICPPIGWPDAPRRRAMISLDICLESWHSIWTFCSTRCSSEQWVRSNANRILLNPLFISSWRWYAPPESSLGELWTSPKVQETGFYKILVIKDLMNFPWGNKRPHGYNREAKYLIWGTLWGGIWHALHPSIASEDLPDSSGGNSGSYLSYGLLWSPFEPLEVWKDLVLRQKTSWILILRHAKSANHH